MRKANNRTSRADSNINQVCGFNGHLQLRERDVVRAAVLVLVQRQQPQPQPRRQQRLRKHKSNEHVRTGVAEQARRAPTE